MNASNLGHKMAAGGLVLVLLRLSIKAIGLLSVIILFRVLTPEDFGVAALAMLVVGLVEVFAEFGFDQSLLRNPQAQRADYDVAWTLNLLRGLAVSALLAAAAPLASLWLQEPRLVPVLWALALAPLMDGLMNIATVDFAKNLEFGKEYRLKVSQKVFSFFVTLIAALVLRNYWALVIGTLASRLIGLILGYAMHPYRPRLSLTGSRSVLAFSTWILTNNLVLYFGNQTDKVLVQRAFSAHSVGVLRIAEELSGMVMELVWPIERALYAGYVKVVQSLPDFRQTVMTSIGLVAALGLPVSLGLGVLAEPAVRLVLGERGMEAVPLVQVFVLHGAIRSCLCGVFPSFMVLGRADVNTKLTMAAVIIRLLTLFSLFPYLGLVAAPMSMVAGSVVSLFAVWLMLGRVGGFAADALPRALWRPLLAALVMAAVGRTALSLVVQWHTALQLLLLVPLCAATYLLSLVSAWWLAGRPAGAERIALGYVALRWTRRRS